MSFAASKRVQVGSGVDQLDRVLGGLFVGDNVVWHDNAGSLAFVFCLNFLRASQSQNKPVIYVSFDRSPKNLLEKLGPLADYPQLTILDCFTCGKGGKAPIFMKFYEELEPEVTCRVLKVDEPRQSALVMDSLYGIHATMSGDVRLIFESITGIEKLWGGEEEFINFYSHSCPRLYELNTIAYWILEKQAHSPRLRAHIKQIAQVVIDLSIKRGTTSMTILKAEGRGLERLHKPHQYWTKDLKVTFEAEDRSSGPIELGFRLKELRLRKGLSQSELAKLVGVTPSNISQVESDLIYPSLPTLLRIAEVLSVDVSSLFREQDAAETRVVFSPSDGVEIRLPNLPEGSFYAKLLTPIDFEAKSEVYLVEIPPEKQIPSHFFAHKGEELGYVLSGSLQVKANKTVYTVRSGEVIYLREDMPSEWTNTGSNVARMLWVKLK